MTLSARISRHAAIAATGILALGFICFAVGLRVNTTRSIPVGLYWMTGAPVGKGEYVIFCPPQSALFDEAKARGYIGAGFCPGNYGYMIKRILALGGDTVTSAEEGVKVNGMLLPASAALDTDKAGRRIPRYPISDYTLKDNELLLMSDVSRTSFDGRYFGPINLSQVKGVITPVILLGSTHETEKIVR